MSRVVADPWPRRKWWLHIWSVDPDKAARTLREALREIGSIPGTARALGISRTTLYSWLQRAELRQGLDLPKVGRPRRRPRPVRPLGRICLEQCEPSANSTT